MTGLDELSGEEVPDLTAAYDDDEHVCLLPALSRATGGSQDAAS